MTKPKYRETEPLKKGELVVMHTCIEARNPKNEGKIWVCKTDQFTRGEGLYEQDSIFLEGFTGSFAPEFLQRVDVVPLLAEKDAAIDILTKQITDEVAISAKAIVERDRLRKALEEIKTLVPLLREELESPSLRYNTANMMLYKIDQALKV